MTATDNEDAALQDTAARMRDSGASWASIATELGLAPTVAKRFAAASDARAAAAATRDQLPLF